MKIKKYTLGGVIPTVQYGNLQPSIEMEGTDLSEMQEIGLDHIKDLHSRFSDKELNETIRSIVSEVKMKSFNEDIEVDFDPDNHKYTIDGKTLESGSVYASKYYKKFDAQGIAKNCEKSWGVKATDIADMWESNGNLSANFGSVVHEALEHYFNHRDTAKTIEENKDDGENKAMPKHPILKQIITNFLKIDNSKGEVLTEVFVTDKKAKRCGQIDRLVIVDKGKKICRVQDYKVNVNAEEESSNSKALKPYHELPKNKITKYQIQMSFYADLLVKSGWIVEGLDVFILEDEWKHVELEVLEIE